MIICLYKITNKCDEHWVVHLRGARDLIRARKQLRRTSRCQQNPIISFVERFSACQDVIGRTACAHEIDIWIPYRLELAQDLCDIAELSRQKQTNSDVALDTQFVIKAASLEEQVD
ncbi:MAG: hypothetical protein M1834_002006 [Cirrosporium novae-zelandiae]|nr:MAG: hypothetical protein M1834_002006 [Cirrosporium novae-zelandiae]